MYFITVFEFKNIETCILLYYQIYIVSISAYNKYTPGDLDVVLEKMQDQEVEKAVEKLFTDKNWLQKMVPQMQKIWPNLPSMPGRRVE